MVRLENTSEAIRFFCTRKFIIEIEKAIFRLYDLLVECGVSTQITSSSKRSPMVYLGNTEQNTQAVRSSPHWSNVYGHDATEEDMATLVQEISLEEKEMLLLCGAFVNAIRKVPIDKKELRKFIHPAARDGWGDFQVAQTLFCSIPNPGMSSKIRYNEKKDTAYVRIFPSVDEAFIIDTPHVFCEVYEFALGKWVGRWMIYQFGGHLDSIYKENKHV